MMHTMPLRNDAVPMIPMHADESYAHWQAEVDRTDIFDFQRLSYLYRTAPCKGVSEAANVLRQWLEENNAMEAI